MRREHDGFGHTVRSMLATVSVAIGIVVLVSLAIKTARTFDELKSASSDNAQWTLSQLEVELATFQTAAANAAIGHASLDELRRRFDIFYSRLDTIRRSAAYAPLREDPGVRKALGDLDAWLDAQIPLIDGPDGPLAAALPSLVETAGAVRPAARQVAIEGIKLFSARSDARRDALRELLLAIASVTAVLLALLATSAFLLLRSYRRAQRQTARVKAANARLRATISASLDAIVLMDGNGIIVDFNGAAEDTFGYSRAEAVGRDLAALLLPPEAREAHARGLAAYLESGESAVINSGRIQKSAVHRSGRIFPAELSIAHTGTPDGELFVAYVRDISDRLEAEQKLIEARDRARAGEQAKSRFLAVMSHEMRTPLNGMLGALELIDPCNLPPDQAELLAIARDSGRLLLRHVNDVLDLASIEKGAAALARRPFRLSEVVRRRLDALRPLARKKKIELELHADKSADIETCGDPDRIAQVVDNLVGNAIKFTEKGGVTVRIGARQNADGSVSAHVAVTDTGPGIPTEQQARIFEDFAMLDSAFDRKVEGTGLGLGIAARIAKAMNGQITVESDLGKGATFRFECRLDPATRPLEDGGGSEDDHGMTRPLRLLVVEDNKVNRLLLCRMLKKAGHDVDEAASGTEGVRMARQSRYDAILTDISMPEMDGIVATRLLRDDGGQSHGVPIIGVTAHAQLLERQRFSAAGMTGCLTKPVSLADVQAELSRIMSDTHLQEPPNLPLVEASKASGLSDPETRQFIGELRGRLEDKASLDQDQIASLAARASRLGLTQLSAALEGLSVAADEDSTILGRAIVLDVARTYLARIEELAAASG